MKQPPKLPLLLLRLFAGRQIMEEIEGDLYEDYIDNLESLGVKKARSLYTWTAIRSLRPYILIHNRENRKPKLIDMVKYHLKMALRNMTRRKVFSAINIFGITIGMASSIAIILFLIDQSQSDNFLDYQDRIYRLEATYQQGQNMSTEATHHGSLMTAIVDNIPGIEEFSRISQTTETLLINRNGNTDRNEETFLFTDPNFLKIFNFNLIAGDPSTALSNPNSVLITVSAAQRYFGNSDPIGQLVEFAKPNQLPKKITGVVEDPLSNSSISFDFLASNHELFPASGNYSFDGSFNISLPVYVLLEPGIKPESIVSKIVPELKKHTNRKNLIEANYALKRFDKVKYDLDVIDGVIRVTDYRLMVIFAIIAVFIISLVIINYINLTSAQSIQRIREVSIRKVVGAQKRTLIAQFLTESFLTVFISLPLSLITLEILIPYLELVLERELVFSYYTSLEFISYLLVVTIGIAVLAGVYPALLLSRFKLSNSVHSQGIKSQGGALLRKILVVFQFTFSIGLIMSSIMIQSQLDFIKGKTLNYAPEELVMLKGGVSMFKNNYETFKTELMSIPGIKSVSISNSTPGDNFFPTMKNKDMVKPIVSYFIDEDYLGIFNIDIIGGRNFSSKSDSTFKSVIINRSLAKSLDIKEPFNAASLNAQRFDNSKIIGVIEDFHLESMHQKIQPVLLRSAKAMPMALTKVVVKMETENFQQTIASLKSVWDEVYPERVFNYEFLDDKLERLYTGEQKMSTIFGGFTFIAIIISCLGLFGLSIHLTQSRIQEVSIRKVLGASVIQIVSLLSKEVYLLIGIAALIATPIVYYCIQQWLNDFEYSVGIDLRVFLLTIGVCLILGTITTGWHTIKTAYTNPSDSLRTE